MIVRRIELAVSSEVLTDEAFDWDGFIANVVDEDAVRIGMMTVGAPRVVLTDGDDSDIWLLLVEYDGY